MRSALKGYVPILVCLALVVLDLVSSAHAGESAMPRVGFVSAGGGATFEAFRQGLRDAGYVEGKNVIMETRFTGSDLAKFPELVAELIAQKVDVLVAGSPPGAIAALKADTSIPIVIAGVADPAGLARKLGRPAHHVTGTSLTTRGIGTRWVAMLKQACPDVARAAVITNPANPSRDEWLAEIREQASAMDVALEIHDATSASELQRALVAIGESAAQGVIVTGDPVFLLDRDRIIAFVAARRLPAVYFSKLFAESGGMLAYGASLEDSYRRASTYVDRILKGKNPGELPMEPAAIDMVVNLRTARTLGMTIPRSLVEEASRVID